MVVRDYILLTLFMKFHNVAQLLCNYYPMGQSPHYKYGVCSENNTMLG